MVTEGRKPRQSIRQSVPGLARKLLGILDRLGLLVVGGFLAFMAWYGPLAQRQDFDYDEGINLMRAQLLADGHALYSEVWSDQPPILTVLLVQWWEWFGTCVITSRILIVVLCALLLWSLYKSARRYTSATAAFASAIFLILSEETIRLSASVMIGLPALAWAMLAAYLVIEAQGRRWLVFTVLSGAVMALALQTKLLAGVAVPALLCHLLLIGDAQASKGNWQERLRQAALWLLSLAAAFVVIGLAFDSLNPELLLLPHLDEQTRNAFLYVDNLAFLRQFARTHLTFVLVAVIGVFWALRRRNSGVVMPLVWLLTSVAAVAYLRPLWHHHVMLLTVPLAWLCAFGAQACVDLTQRRSVQAGTPAIRQPRYLVVALLLLALTIALADYPQPLAERIDEWTYRNRPYYNRAMLDRLQADSQNYDGWIFTDRPFYAYQAGLPIPPPMAVLSRKRLQSGNITQQELIASLESYRPTFVVIERFVPEYGPALIRAIEAGYDLVAQAGPTRYYVLKGEPN